MSDKKINRKIAVIFATDVVGYSKHMEADESETILNLRKCEELLLGLFEKYEGRLFNTGGDSFLAEFSSAVSAVECAVEFQNAIQHRNSKDDASVKLEFRIGINSGDVVKEKDNLLGDGVNIAARLEALAQTGGITISKSVYEFVQGKTRLKYNNLGVQQVKQNSFHAYDVLINPLQKRKLASAKSYSLSKYAVALLLILVLFAGSTFYVFTFQNRPMVSQQGYAQSDIRNVLIKPSQFLSRNESLSYLAQGFTTYLGTSLSQHPSLNVLPETSANFVQNNKLTNSELRAEYKIDYVIENSMQISGSTIRVTTKISDLMEEQVIASEVYEFSEDEVFQYQDKITELALQKMSMMDHSGSGGLRISTNPTIYKNHILARANMLLWTPEGHFKAMTLVEEMLEIEPENGAVKQMLGWLLQQKVYLGLSEDTQTDLKTSLEIVELNLKIRDEGKIDAIALASSNEALLGFYDEACARLPNMNKLLIEKQTKAGPHEYAMTAWINQNCENFEVAVSTYEQLFKKSPHYSAWVRYYYAYTLLALNKFEQAEKFIIENQDLNYSYYGTNEIFKLCLVYIAHKKQEITQAKQYYEEYQSMPNSLGLGYLEGDFAAARSKDFFKDFAEILKIYGML